MKQKAIFGKNDPYSNKRSRLSLVDLTIIIVNYKTKEKLSTCLDSILATNKGYFSYEIILVENNSGDELSSFVKKSPCIRLITSYLNLGYGKGNNLAIDNADGEYILILNPDIIVTKNSIDILLNYLKDNPDVGVVGPKQLNLTNALQYSCLRFPNFYMPILRRTTLGKYFTNLIDHFKMSDFDHNSIKEVDWLTGSAIMFKKILMSNGKEYCPRFDERYFMYFEDVDICRTVRNNKLKVVYNPEAILYHESARKSGQYPWYKAIFCNYLFLIHINSWIKYFLKWGI